MPLLLATPAVDGSASTSATVKFSGQRSSDSEHQSPTMPPPTTTTSALAMLGDRFDEEEEEEEEATETVLRRDRGRG